MKRRHTGSGALYEEPEEETAEDVDSMARSRGYLATRMPG
jgi:hypothetical protein